jgi:hypothetical protein
MDIKQIIAVVEKGVAFAQEFMPLATAIGGPAVATAVKVIETVNEVITHAQTRIAESGVVLASTDEAQIKGFIAALAAENDKLMAYVDAS